MLSRLSPERLSIDRDRLFFRAGEASAHGEAQSRRRWRARLWPAAAAAMAMVAAVLSVTLADREPEVRIVYVKERAINAEAQPHVPSPDVPESFAVEGQLDREHRGLADGRSDWFVQSDGLIHPRDRAALSEAFARQLSLQQERSEAKRNETIAMGEQDREGESRDETARNPARTYMEIRQMMQAM
jgi:hypothetical protein